MTPPPSRNKNRKPGLTAKGDQRQYVRHSYTDRSNDIVENLTTSDENTVRLYREDSVGGPFPLKLQIVLKVTEKLGQQHIISWLPHGRSFMIHRPREFEEEVMGKFFKQTKLTSFRRQLNLYDFQRITHGRDAGSYYHELFLRGRPLLAKRMIRRKVKGTKIRASSSPDDEPNFYTMTFMGPITDYPTNNHLGGRSMVGMDPHHHHHQQNYHDVMLGAAAGGNLNSSALSRLQAGGNGLGFPYGSSLRGALNNHDHINGTHPSSLQHHQGALGSLQNPLHHQNPFYSDLMHQRMQLSQSYGGSMENLNYSNALAASALHRNNLASSLAMSNERLAAEARYGAANPALLSREAELLSMASMRGGAGPGGDPRLSNFNESLLGASSQLGGGGGGGNYPGSLSSMLPSHSSLTGAVGLGAGATGLGAGATGLGAGVNGLGVNNNNGIGIDHMNGGLNNNSAAAALNRQSILMQQQQQEQDAVYSQLLRSRQQQQQHAALMSSLPNNHRPGELGPAGPNNVFTSPELRGNGGASNNMSLIARMAGNQQSNDGKLKLGNGQGEDDEDDEDDNDGDDEEDDNDDDDDEDEDDDDDDDDDDDGDELKVSKKKELSI